MTHRIIHKKQSAKYLTFTLLVMNSEDEHTESEVFDVPNFIDTQMFAFDSNPSKSSLSTNNSCFNYLRETIGESLSYALSYVIFYRPDDAIEFIANFLIDWSRKKSQQKASHRETNDMSTSMKMYHEQCLIDDQQKHDAKRLLIEQKEKQQKEIIFEYDKHVLMSHQWDFYLNPRTADEREPFIHVQEPKEQIHRTNIRQHIHTHDTASGFNDEMKSNRDNHKNRICHDGNLSSSTYFSALKDKIIRCDES